MIRTIVTENCWARNARRQGPLYSLTRLLELVRVWRKQHFLVLDGWVYKCHTHHAAVPFVEIITQSLKKSIRSLCTMFIIALLLMIQGKPHMRVCVSRLSFAVSYSRVSQRH